MARQKTSKDSILDAAYDMATRRGLQSVNARSISASCGVSVGTIYNYYPSMDELCSDIIERFFQGMFADAAFHPAPGENFVVYCRQLFSRMQTTLKVFREDWLDQIESMTASMRATGRKREGTYMHHMVDGMARVLAADEDIDKGRLLATSDAEEVSAFAFNAMVDAIRRHQGADPLFSMLAYALYPDGSHGRKAALASEG